MARSKAAGFGTSQPARHKAPQPAGNAETERQRQRALQAIRAGQLDLASEIYRQLVAAGAASAADCSNLAAILLSRGRASEAIPLLQRGLELDAANPETWLNLGTALHASADLAGAAEAFRRAIALRPDFAKAHANLGNTLQSLQDLVGALEAYERALALQPDYPEVLSNRGYALIELGQPHEALSSIEEALQRRPDHADAHNNRGLALRELGQLDAALEAHRRALHLQPGSADVLSNIGVAELERGRITAAIAAFEQALASEAHHPLAHRHLALCVNARRQPEALQRSRNSLAARLAAGDDAPDRFHLHFAVGKYLLDVDDAEAIEQLQVANRLRRQQFRSAWRLPDLEQTLEQQHQRIARWTVPSSGAAPTDPCRPTLLFIVGLPRCGSTLVETILSQAAGVVDLGEAPLLDQAIAAADVGDPAAVNLETLYRSLAAGHRPASNGNGTVALTDKYLYNVVHCQLIAAALPGSRIIHVHRNPMDNLLSLFSNHFARGNEWTYDLDDAVAYYDLYRRLMRAHEQAMPGRIFHLSYDDLARNPARMLPELLAHCGLPWDDACLTPHTSTRTIQTASAVQARQPIHAGSVGRWQRHAAALAPWAERLEELGYSTAIPPLPQDR